MNILMYTPHFSEFPAQLFGFLANDQRINFKGFSSFKEIKRELDCSNPAETLLLMGREIDFHDVANMPPDEFEYARECFYLRQAAKTNGVRVIETADLVDSLVDPQPSDREIKVESSVLTTSLPLEVEQRFVDALYSRFRHKRLDLH